MTLQGTLENRDGAWVLTMVRDLPHPPERDPAAMNAAGWHLCLDVLTGNLNGEDTPRVVGADAVKHGWEALRDLHREGPSSLAR